jgi:hypothetical protein
MKSVKDLEILSPLAWLTIGAVIVGASTAIQASPSKNQPQSNLVINDKLQTIQVIPEGKINQKII